jgi:hypothetical protein
MRTDYNSPVRIAFRYIGYLSLVLLVGTLVYTMNYTFISKNDRQRLHDENGKLSREVQSLRTETAVAISAMKAEMFRCPCHSQPARAHSAEPPPARTTATVSKR